MPNGPLGKLTLCQLSYSRSGGAHSSIGFCAVKAHRHRQVAVRREREAR